MSDVKFSLYEKGLVKFYTRKGQVNLKVGKTTHNISNADRNNLGFLKIMIKMRQPDYETFGKVLEAKVDEAKKSDINYKASHTEKIETERPCFNELEERMNLVRSFEKQLLSGVPILQIKDSLKSEIELDALAEAYLNLQDIEYLKSLGMDDLDAYSFQVLTLDPSLNDRAYNCMCENIKKRTK